VEIEASSTREVLIVTSASVRIGAVGMGGVVPNTASGGTNDDAVARYYITISPRDE
jgi:hypothetical protein